jgi:outer membrane lipoprotein SlyB
MESTPAKLHPLLTIAALSVTVASLAGIGVMTGVLPSPGGHGAPKVDETTAVAAQAVAPPPAVAAPIAEAPAVETDRVVAAPPPAKPVVRHSKPAPRFFAGNNASVPPPVPTTQYAASSMPPAPPDYRPASAAMPPAPPAVATCRDCGTVESVREVVVQSAQQGPGIGAVAGGILGGVLGHQMGHGRGNDVATVLGAVGGAFAGNQIEKTQRRSVRYEIAVRMDDGTMQVLSAEHTPAWRGGERVKVTNGVATPML